jgi:hypothetical protein
LTLHLSESIANARKKSDFPDTYNQPGLVSDDSLRLNNIIIRTAPPKNPGKMNTLCSFELTALARCLVRKRYMSEHVCLPNSG